MTLASIIKYFYKLRISVLTDLIETTSDIT